MEDWIKCSSMKTIKVAFPRPHPVGTLLFVIRPPSLGSKSLKYRARVTIINRSNYHFLSPFQLSMPIFVCSQLLYPRKFACPWNEGLLVVYFSQIKQFCAACGRPGFKSRPVTTNKGSLSKRKCHSAVCLRPFLRPDNRELRLIIGKGNNNIAHLIIVKAYSGTLSRRNFRWL